jgi:hypothetical protein
MSLRRLLLLPLCLVLLTGCGRPLTEAEQSFAATMKGDTLDIDRVRLVRGAMVGSVTFQRQPRPRVACRERIVPPPENPHETVTVSPAAVALFNRVFFTHGWYLDDYLDDYPETLDLVAAMLFAHELTHVWQWQNRAETGYHPLRAATEHTVTDDPYLFDLDGAQRFLDYGFEQQGAIVEEYVCCRALDPQAARTQRLHDMIGAAMPLTPLPEEGREYNVLIPWKDAEIDGICS